jgi:glycosyltransferase involved in cell wall biosynthesis
MPEPGRLVRVFAPTYADERFSNAQQVNAREIAARLDPERFRVTLLWAGSDPSPLAARPPVRLARLPSRGRAAAVLGLLLRGGYDLLWHPQPALPESLFLRLPRLLPARRARVLVPVEGDVGQYDEVAPAVRRRADRLLRRADALFPITEHVAATLRARVGRDGEVIPIGVDSDVFRPRAGPRRPGPLRVLSVGTVKPWKRPELAAAAARALPSASFEWIGDGPGLEAARASAPANLRFSGPVARADLPARLSDADVLLHPGRREGLPKVILEAAASGLPTVAFSDHDPRYLTEHGAGIVVSTPEEMSAALARLAADAPARARMGEAARRFARTRTWEAAAAAWAAAFGREAALAGGGAP